MKPVSTRAALLSASFLITALVGSPSALAQDTANPESKPLEDSSRKANEESRPVEDKGDQANQESTKVEDTDTDSAGDAEDTEKVEDTKRGAGNDSRPVRDKNPKAAKDARELRDENRKANRASREERDRSDRASRDAEKVRDRDTKRASEDARRVRDKDVDRASPDAEPVEKEPQQREDAADRPMTDETRPESTDAEPTAPTEEAEVAKPTPVPPKAEEAVKAATAEVERDLNRRKLQLKDKGQARDVIRDLIGSEGRLSRVERQRERAAGIRPDRRRSIEQRAPQHREAVDFLKNRLLGRAPNAEAPQFFRPAQPAGQRVENRLAERNRLQQPRYLRDGRRYVYYDSRSAVPAILLATAALDRMRVQSARDLQPGFFGDESTVSLPPESYRSKEAVVVSYPVSTGSMMTSNDILFVQGSTQFSDQHSYEMLWTLEEALLASEMSDQRFVIEGHASAEGSYENNLALSQRRAETIVRELVRAGVDPERLVPVGFGESEARYPADAKESLRSQDRRVVVFRMDESATASR